MMSASAVENGLFHLHNSGAQSEARTRGQAEAGARAGECAMREEAGACAPGAFALRPPSGERELALHRRSAARRAARHGRRRVVDVRQLPRICSQRALGIQTHAETSMAWVKKSKCENLQFATLRCENLEFATLRCENLEFGL